ncbi:hypothetical protein [Haloarchaeobius iranensis]|uniref:Uncharacterized protein n=1 Tax=Haloarchaeobius iranensis TaxID=996166 RepID=A0A1H0C656_9EURY|nr:hypothetical protein [Haloarchaeobius iranensis]SDN53374.1 hypothetical protein SAMN05192554_1612 [Haloarchaeobius iranensis]
MSGASLQRFAILLMLYGGIVQITELLILESGGSWGPLETGVIYVALLLGFVGLVVELRGD